MGEGSGILVLEDLDHALARGARIYGEILGYNTCGSGGHVSQSNKDAVVQCIKAALEDAGVSEKDVDYINAHATATPQGDMEEAQALREIFGDGVPVSSLKGHLAHTLGASGAIEMAFSLLMMEKGMIIPTLNLETIDPECEGIFHVTRLLEKEIKLILKNCFAFGGINASLVCKKWES